MSSITNIQLAEAFARFLTEKRGYVWAAQGELFTPELAAKWTKAGRSVPPGENKATYFTGRCAKWYGRYVDDCSGGIVDAIRLVDPGFGDRTANTFKAQFTEGGPVSTIPEIPGLAVWKSGHIGIYVGGGYVIEFRGTDFGCVKTRLKDRPWTHWGKIRGVEYVNAATSKDEPAPGGPAKAVIVTGGSVNVRSGSGTNYGILTTVHQGDRLTVLGQENDWTQVALSSGKTGWVSDKYLRKE
jgi:hypothetical protein